MAAEFFDDHRALEGLDLLRQAARQRGRAVCRRAGLRQMFVEQPEHEAVCHVAQLAHVARPGVGHQFGELGAGRQRGRALVARGRKQREMLEQQRDVFASLAQRRQLDHRDADAVVQVGAKLLLIAQRLQVVLAGGDHAAVEGNGLVGADALDAALLQGAQQLDLHGHRHALDLVEEQRAAMRMLELAHAHLVGAGEGAGLVAEEFALDQVLRQAAAVQRHVVLATAFAVVVQAARHQLLAGAGFAVDQHVGRCLGQRHHRAPYLLHAGRAADEHGLDALPVVQRIAQRAHLQAQLPALDRMAHGGDQPLGRVGLLDEVVGTFAHGLHRHRDVAVAGDEDHRQLGVDGAYFRQPVGAARARQTHVADDDGRHAGGDVDACALDTGKRIDLEAGQAERLGGAQAHVLVVLDEHHADGSGIGLAHGLITPVLWGRAGRPRNTRRPRPG